MRRVIALPLVILALVLTPGTAGAIVYGEFDANQHPNVGALVYQRDGTFRIICSGTLISPTIFLTAAHCTQALADRGIEADDVWVTFDATFDQKSPLLAGTYDLNENYNQRQSDPQDIAVVILDKAVKNIQPAELPTEGLLDELQASHQLDDQTFTAVGYGTVRHSRKTGWQGIEDSDERRFALQSFNALTGAWLKLSMNEATGDGGTCYGDSGGPHFLGGVDSNLLVSITVTGDAVCKATDVTYRLDTANAREYLSQFVALP